MFKKLICFIPLLLLSAGFNKPEIQQQINIDTNVTQSKLAPTSEISLQQSALKNNSARNSVRNAAVSVVTTQGMGSGTYFKIGDHYIVITAYHVVQNQDVAIVDGRNNEQVYAEPIIKSIKGDIAVLLIPKLSSREPLKLKTLSDKDAKKIDKLIGKEVTYTGFPSHHDLLTVDGKIANVEDGYIIMHSYAWPGSSGSGVFDFKGRLVGIVSAVDLGQWHPQIPPAIVEDMVWVSPSWDISEKDIKKYLNNRGASK